MQLKINELFGPTIQGEGPDVGRACYFIRLHHCPVQCPGCDTHFSWDGSEPGLPSTVADLSAWMQAKHAVHPHAGFVVSGGEPLIHFANEELATLFTWYRSRSWITLETSGFVGPKELKGEQEDKLRNFLTSFSRVICSPKITPCLHGTGWTDEQLEVNLPAIFKYFRMVENGGGSAALHLKFVIRDEADVTAVRSFLQRHGPLLSSLRRTIIYAMPYGIEAEEVAEGCKFLVDVCARTGWTLSPRLHALLWGKKRGV
jgi:7-carboxy-7-deazaguanine synthase